ncbi:hypothetical protein [Dokdonia sp.]|uniref:hypothetical protein n=1 Tax=Dokdonia sp. TaxID=2024995 RepID=UPI003263BA60
MEAESVIQFIIQIAILFVILYLAFFKSYLTEKGKSAALKEDLENLTREVESVKNEFVKEQEMLKTDLQRVLDNEVSYRNEERNAIIDFHGIINQWIFSVLEINLSLYNKNNIDELIKIRNRNSSFYSKSGIAQSKVTLLIEDSILSKITVNLFISVIKFHSWCDVVFLKYQLKCEGQKILADEISTLMENFEENKESIKVLSIERARFIREQHEMDSDYISNRKIELDKVYIDKKSFEDLIKEYLKN